jgi:hypothetical protein
MELHSLDAACGVTADRQKGATSLRKHPVRYASRQLTHSRWYTSLDQKLLNSKVPETEALF